MLWCVRATSVDTRDAHMASVPSAQDVADLTEDGLRDQLPLAALPAGLGHVA